MNKYALFGLELHGQKINGKDAHARDGSIQSCNVVFFKPFVITIFFRCQGFSLSLLGPAAPCNN